MFHTVEGRYSRIKADNEAQQVYFAKMGVDYSKEMRRSVRVALEDWIKKPGKNESLTESQILPRLF